MTRHLDAQEPQEFDAWDEEDRAEGLQWTDDDIDHNFDEDLEWDHDIDGADTDYPAADFGAFDMYGGEGE